MRRLVPVFLLAFLVGCGPSETPPPPADSAASAEDGPALPPPPDVANVDAEQLLAEVGRLDADLIFVNVWATWCGPCRVEFPEFVRFGRDKAGEDIAVRFLSVDDEGALPQMISFLRQQGVTGRTYLSSIGSGIVAELAAPRRWSYGIPATVVVNREGRVIDFWEGAVNYDFLAAKAKQLLTSPPTDQTAVLR